MPKKPIQAAKGVVIVSDTSHPAVFRKIRCPKCKGYAAGDPHKLGKYNCSTCGVSFSAMNL
jgi:DNA-directed RNA polymerase subunit RPC12/RpoP